MIINNESNSNKSKSAATSPTAGSTYRGRFLGGTAVLIPGTNKKNVVGNTGAPNSSSANSSRLRGSAAQRRSNYGWVCPSDRQLALRAR